MTQPKAPPPRALPGRGVRLASVNGVPIYVSPISLLFLIYMGVRFDELARNRLAVVSDNLAYTLGAALAVITLLSIVLHEIGHSLVAQGFRFNVRAITIYGFVGLTEFEPEPETPLRAFVVSVSGPLVNIAIGVPALFWYMATDPNSAVGVLALGTAYVNLALGIFNLLPGLPFDGGAAFAAGVWKVTGDRQQSNRVAAYGGFVVAGGLAIWGLSSDGRGAGAYTFGVAVLVALGAGASLKRSKVIAKVPSVVASQVQRRAVTVEANLPLAEALRRAEVLGVTAVIVNDSSGRPWALMNGAAADAVPAARRPWTTINQVSRPIEDGMRIPESLGGQELMDRLQTTPASEYLVYGADDRPTGVLVMVDVVARIDPAAAARLAARR
jgi:Zn-dependent protease